jgi:dTDP-4-dehydrorhamnose 3,5-epimerase
MGAVTIEDTIHIDGVVVTPQKKIAVNGGDVYHAMKRDEVGYHGFGEAYFSTINSKTIKAWKRHNEMTMNLVVPAGAIRFVIFDDRPDSESFRQFQQVNLSEDNYCRLTIAPQLWMGFQGLGSSLNLLLNLADIAHRPEEIDRKKLNSIMFDWRS